MTWNKVITIYMSWYDLLIWQGYKAFSLSFIADMNLTDNAAWQPSAKPTSRNKNERKEKVEEKV